MRTLIFALYLRSLSPCLPYSLHSIRLYALFSLLHQPVLFTFLYHFLPYSCCSTIYTMRLLPSALLLISPLFNMLYPLLHPFVFFILLYFYFSSFPFLFSFVLLFSAIYLSYILPFTLHFLPSILYLVFSTFSSCLVFTSYSTFT